MKYVQQVEKSGSIWNWFCKLKCVFQQVLGHDLNFSLKQTHKHQHQTFPLIPSAPKWNKQRISKTNFKSCCRTKIAAPMTRRKKGTCGSMHVLSTTVFLFLIDHIYRANESQASKDAQLKCFTTENQTSNYTNNKVIKLLQFQHPKEKKRLRQWADSLQVYCSRLHTQCSTQGNLNPNKGGHRTFQWLSNREFKQTGSFW